MAPKKKAKQSLHKHIVKHHIVKHHHNKAYHKEYKPIHKTLTTSYHKAKRKHRYALPHTGSIQHHQQSKLEYMLQRVPIYPMVVGIIGIVLLALMAASTVKTPIGMVVKDSVTSQPYCLKEGRDGYNYKVTDKGECCFLIANADRCAGPWQQSDDYKNAYTGKIEGVYQYSYSCYGSTSRRVLFTSLIKNYCNVNI